MSLLKNCHKKKCLILLGFVFGISSIFAQKSSSKAPDWYLHQDVVYPSERFITAVGEGSNRNQAENAALATISLYFQTSTDVCNNMIKRFNEREGNGTYSFSKGTQIVEKARITSQSEFFGVQFAQGFTVDKKFTTLAYIDRDEAFLVYNQRIDVNVNILRSLLLIAEDFNNPIFGVEAVSQGLSVAEITEQLVKMARIVKKVDTTYFKEAESMCERIRSAYQICKSNLIFQIKVENDYEDMVSRTLSDLLEDNGYSVSKTNGICTLPVTVTVEREDLPAGVFLWCGIVVNIATGDGDDIFSYSRNFQKKGAKSEQMAYRRAYQEIQKELQATFMQEFSQKVHLYE